MNVKTKKARLQMHENLHKNVNENMQIFMRSRAIKAANALHCEILIC